MAQTAEVLNLVERLRENGLAVILISHNMSDVMAVADRVSVLRLGRNNGTFDVGDTTMQEMIAAITGATTNAVSERASRRPDKDAPELLRKDTGRGCPMTDLSKAPAAGAASLPADLQDERLISSQGVAGYVRAFLTRLRGGDLGSLPVVVGLVVIWAIFQLQNDAFLSSRNLVNLTLQCAATGTIALGIVLVLMLGEIDLSVGSVSGLSAAILGVGLVGSELPLLVAVIAALAAGAAIGLVYGLLYTQFGVPSFVITLAGLLGVLGLQLTSRSSRG